MGDDLVRHHPVVPCLGQPQHPVAATGGLEDTLHSNTVTDSCYPITALHESPGLLQGVFVIVMALLGGFGGEVVEGSGMRKARDVR